MMRCFFVVAFLVSMTMASRACINDRDSDALAIQNKRLPDVLRVISGRFERNPPRYYQMRIARVEAELQSNPRQFGLYDDLAVAHDRLGDDVAAMQVMAQKRAMLPAFNTADKENKEAWYRYFANDGTFRAHRFLHEGAKDQNLDAMRQGCDEIARAIQIKPNAHFGREQYQLVVMEWIIARKTNKTEKSLADFMGERFSWDQDRPRDLLSEQRQEAAQGLSGLIVLGAAWQSPDVFDALGSALESRYTIALSHLARKRCDELQSAGVASLSGQAIGTSIVAFDEREMGLNNRNKETLDTLYPQLRQEADQWNASRAQWMEAKFARGQHPDTDTDFWQSFPESEPPSLDVEWFQEGAGRQPNVVVTLVVGLVALLFGPTLLILLLDVCFRGWVKRKTKSA